MANGVKDESVELQWPLTTARVPRVITGGLNVGDWIFRAATATFALVSVAVLISIFLVLFFESSTSIRTFGFGFLYHSTWDPVAKDFGALPFIFGTLVSSLLALLQAVPLSIGTAAFLSEMAPGWVRAPVSFLVELLATIPSVIYGLWGVFVLIPWMRTVIGPALSSTLGFLPFFQGPNYGVGMLTASMILAVMIVPYITSVSLEVIRAVPTTQREAALALGATKWEMVRVAVLPFGRTGIIGAVMLGLGRAIGETMAVTMVIGNRAGFSLSLFAPGSTMASVIANEFTEATYDLYVQALVEIGLVLLIVTVVVNALAQLLVWSVAGPEAGTRA
jgi:phosphate transport system permease protein